MKLDNPGKGQQRRSPFGMRKHPKTGVWKMHNGIDYGGTFKVKAAQDGIVVKKGANMDPLRGFGNSLTIDHGSGIRTLYAHGASASSFNVSDRIKRGDVIFTSGATGAATGPHLHFEVHLNGKPVDPEPYYTSNGVDPVVPVMTTGRLDRETWRRWQSVLKKSWKYDGIIDGIPGVRTWSAIQRSVVEYGYKGPIDGKPGPNTRRAVQQRLHDKGFYNGKIDGIWGRVTITALQVALTENKY